MTYYTIDNRQFKKNTDWIGRVIITALILLGILIGAGLGLYVAAKTLPLPVTNNNNFYRTP